MKNIAVIFGGKLSLYISWFNVFKEIEGHFHCTIKRKGMHTFFTKINNMALTFYFCINPIRDNNYRAYEYYYSSTLKGVLPLPANEIAKKIRKDSDKILFAGLCGTICNGRKGDIHTPKLFQKCYFPNSYIQKEQIPQIKPSDKIKIKNYLCLNKDKKKSKVITTNLTLVPDFIEGGSEGLISLSQNLSSYGDIVDKESYEIAAQSNGIPIGLMLMTSDVLCRKNGMIKNTLSFVPNKRKFNNALMNSIKTALESD